MRGEQNNFLGFNGNPKHITKNSIGFNGNPKCRTKHHYPGFNSNPRCSITHLTSEGSQPRGPAQGSVPTQVTSRTLPLGQDAAQGNSYFTLLCDMTLPDEISENKITLARIYNLSY